VLHGAGDVFCAGADLSIIAEGPAGPRALHVAEDGDAPLGVSRLQLSKPVIAAVEGYAVAGGLELALWCDLRVAGVSAVFGVFCRRWGVPLMDGGTIRLPRLLGHSHALDMILTGRGVSGDEARMMGLANRIVANGHALRFAVALAEDLCKLPQFCMRSDRRSSYEQWALDIDAALLNETRRGMDVLAHGETIEGARRFAAGEGRHGQFPR
jgi:enoyl-CoA hydratase